MMGFLKRIIAGFGLGLGFAIAAVAVLYLSSEMMMGKMTEDAYSEAEVRISEGFGYRKFEEGSDIGIKSHREREIKNGVEILAEVENSSDITWSSVNVEVELFDAQDQFVDECSAYLRGSLAPQQVKNVKIRCGGCEKNPLPAYERYTIKVVNASTF